MIRVVTIQNTSDSEVAIGDRTIPALGSLVMPYGEYTNKAIEYDLSSFPIEILLPDIELKKVSVKGFGAKGDGLTDDTKAIQSAIDDVSTYGGGIVEVPIGVYIVDGLIISDNVSLMGESKLDSVFKLKSGSGNAILSLSGASCEISKMRFVGNGE